MEEQVLEQPHKRRKVEKSYGLSVPSSEFAPKRMRRNAITEQDLSPQELAYLQKLAALSFNAE